MKYLGLAAFAVIMATSASAADAEKLACGGDYVATKGDTVYQLASRVFGPGKNRQLFVNALLYRHGDRGGALAEGAVIYIPCATESGLELKKGYWSNSQPISVAVATVGYDQAAPHGSGGAKDILKDLLSGAMEAASLTPTFHVLPGEDAAARRPFAKGEMKGALSFPWFASECAAKSSGARPKGALCSTVSWSDPLFEVTSGVYVRKQAGDKSLDRHASQGLCIADESRGAALRGRAFRDRIIRSAIGGDSADCLSALRRGDVSAAVVADFAAAADKRRNRDNAFRRVPGVAFVDTAHAVIAAQHPASPRILKRLNEGVARIRTSGDWYGIVRANLTDALLN